MKTQQKSIQLEFNCQENPDSFSNSENGEFCSACQKEVIDFTSMSYSQVQKVRGSQSEMCGKFRADQIDPSLRPIELPKARSLAFLSTVFLSLNFGSVSAQSTVDPKIEQAQGASNAPNLTPEEVKEKTESGQHVSMSRAEAAVVQKSSQSEIIQSKRDRMLKRRKRRLKKKLFMSWRFPFVHRKSNYKGRFY